MAKGSYIGGSTIVHAGSGFFTHKGGPGKNRKNVDGHDEPGPAKSGSICDFGPLKRKQKKVIEFGLKKSPMTDEMKQQRARVRAGDEAKRLLNRITGGAAHEERRIAQLRDELKSAERRRNEWLEIAKLSSSFSTREDDVAQTVQKLKGLVRRISPEKPKTEGKRRSRKQKAQGR
jgi:hypothetical protein